MTDEPVRTAGPDRRRLARVPGVLRPSPPGARRPRGPLRRDRGGSRRRPRSLAALAAADLIVIGPSNPIVSLGPILAVPGHGRGDRRGPPRGRPRRWRSAASSAARRSRVRRTGCSTSLGYEATRARRGRAPRRRTRTRSCSTPSTRTLEPAIAALGLRTLVTDTIMADDAGRARLAADLLELARIAARSPT